MSFGEKLKGLRTGLKLTQKQLANRLGVSKSVVSYYELGDKYPSYDILVKISRIFNVTTDYLLDIDRKKVVDVSELSDEDVTVIISVVNALKRQR